MGVSSQSNGPGHNRLSYRKRGKPDRVDALVGQKIKHLRMQLELSQEQLADAIGVSFQQLQKYERGVNRVGAGRLYALAVALQVPVDYFFTGAAPESEAATAAPPSANGSADVLPEDLSVNPEARRLVHAYYRIEDKSVRQNLVALMKELAAAL